MAKKTVKLTGIDKVMKNLSQEVSKIEGRTLGGLIRGSILVRRHMAHNSPKVPIDFGNLNASWFTTTASGKGEESQPSFKGSNAGELASSHSAIMARAKSLAASTGYPVLYMGFTANYAFWVHENVGAKFSRPGSGAKFFESALKTNKAAILEEIRKNVKL